MQIFFPMKLQLYINGIPFNDIKLPDEEFENDPDVSFEDNVEIKKERLEVYIEHMKTIFFRQLCKCKNYEILLIAESKLNFLPVNKEEYEQLS